MAAAIRTGAPSSAQITPAGVSSSRPKIRRPATSALTTIAAPHGIAIASCAAWPRGRAARAIAADSTPTNAIGPATPTATAVSSTAATTDSSRVSPLRSPSARAVLSPSAATSSARPSPKQATSTTPPISAPAWTWLQPDCSRLPAPHRNRPLVSVSRSSWMAALIAASARLIAMPASTIRTGAAPATEAIAPISSAPRTTPTNATAIVDAPGATEAYALVTVTASVPPAVSPRVAGSASGLRVIAISRTAAAPSAAPATTPETARGSRTSRTSEPSSVPRSWRTASSTVCSDRPPAPCAMSATTATSSSPKPATANSHARRVIARRRSSQWP